MGGTMRILIADDHPIVRHGLKQMLASEGLATIVGEATNGDEALELARKVEWDVAIVDFTMPGRSGLELVGDMKQAFPGRPVLVLSMHSEEVHGARVLRGGAAGYLTKETAPQELTAAVRKVAGGGKYVSAALAEILASEYSSEPGKAPHERLSDREYRVMWLLAAGKQIKEISKELGLSPSTVSTYRHRILRKLGITSNAALVQYAVRNQLIH
jgi:DNA-binding NarL/FixJ family response regulator